MEASRPHNSTAPSEPFRGPLRLFIRQPLWGLECGVKLILTALWSRRRSPASGVAPNGRENGLRPGDH